MVFAVFLATACGAASRVHAAAPMSVVPPPVPVAAGATATGGAPIATQIPEAVVVEGSVSVEVDKAGAVVPAIHARVEQDGGRVVNEAVSGDEQSWSAQLKLRVPPDKVDDLLALLARRGRITDRHITATDVSRQLFDQDIALKNLHVTLDRLTQLMAQGGLKLDDVLRIEQEMTRIRGQIEQLEGDQRFMKDRVALATLDVTISRRAAPEVHLARAKVYPGVRAATLVLLDPNGRPRTRYGGGLVIHSVLRSFSFELDVFQQEPNAAGTSSSQAVLATLGGAVYSDFLGGGTRRFLNPYLGMRLGYGYLDGSRFVAQGEAGVELFKTKAALLEANVRLTGLVGKSSDLGVVGAVGAVFAF